jgi:EAL domain-containing protein (putative c-di-GMP-specific phosphodiesterase class I)
MRLLATLPAPPAVFLVSRQLRAVIKAALALATELGIAVAGFCERPGDAEGAADRLDAFVAPAPARRATDARPLERLELLDLLDRGAVVPWFQPKVRLASREVVGFEALMRARDAAGRLILPERLIGALGEHGLLDRATLVMAEGCVDFVAARLAQGMAISASLNVSMQSLSSMDLCQALERCVARAGLDPSWLGIEITETDAMSDLTTVIETTTRIRMLGFNLSIDDFGTAYSSFLQLSRIPFSELKIERAFVTDVAKDPVKRAIVSACAQLGASLGLHVVAEGVETAEELEAVQRLGCTQAQGYLLARPMPGDEATDWLHALHDLQVPF